MQNLASTILILWSVLTSSALESNLFPFGFDEGDNSLPRDKDDISSSEVRLMVPIIFYGQRYNSLYVNQNGLISFLIEVPAFINIQFPLDYPSIASFYSDVDTRIAGSIFYRETKTEKLLDVARMFLAHEFSSATNFKPNSLFIATWDGVGSFDRKSDKINTFQLVIASDGEDSYVIFIYENIEWIQGTGKNPSMPDAKAQAGFISGSGPHFSLKGSGTDQVSSLHKRSNVGQRGMWAFKIGKIDEVPQEPDVKIATGAGEVIESCEAGGAAICHSRAHCIDYSPGFCCQCGTGYYGNGKTCFENDIPERAVGKVKGLLNGIAINDADLYSYVVPADGRAYTAIAKIVDRLGYDFQSLSVIGAIFGWLFSLSVKGAPNGFQVTGGVFNYTTEVSFLQTGHKITINQAYTGLDVFNQLKVDTRIHGTTSVVPVGMKIEIGDFDILLTRVSPGLIRSKSNHNYRIEGTSTDNPFSIEQTISYEECAWAAPLSPELQTTKMKIGRSYIEYDATQEIVRYATTSTISPPDGEDPCKENADKCRPLSSCVADGNSFKCICNLGYEEEYVEGGEGQGPQCVDIDECRGGISDCDVTAHCINLEGSYDCRCRETYVGDGRTCSKMLTCSDVQCGGNAECIEVKAGEPECRCISGYQGDGLFCVEKIIDDDYDSQTLICRTCDRNAECVYDHSVDAYTCKCRSDYYGNGTICIIAEESRPVPELADCLRAELCDPYADCLPMSNREPVVHHCVCRFPFVGDGYSCRDSRVPDSQTLICRTCDRNAECVYDHSVDAYTCKCRSDYYGNGTICIISEESRPVPEPSDCLRAELCDPYADCLPMSNREPVVHHCVCRFPFVGDGYSCRDSRVPDSQTLICGTCDGNAECVYDLSVDAYTCKCRSDYYGNGTICISSKESRPVPEPSDCLAVELCDPYADCLPISNREPVVHHCVCRFPFVGDGYSCRDSRVPEPAVPNPLPVCTFGGACWCPPEFQFDDIHHKCEPKNPDQPTSCESDASICDLNAECVSQRDGYRCVCNAGYYGDGRECLLQDLCSGHGDCGAYGECRYNRTELRYRCECKEGFLKDARDQCQPGPNAGCDILNNCDANGRCVWEARLSKFQCECKPGFLGDGFACQEDMTGCNVLNDCARNAECSYDTESKRFQCHCRQGFEGNGKFCRSSIPCYQDATVCDVNAECRPNPETREWKCHCKLGFAGDGFDCQDVAHRESQFLLVTKGMSLIKIGLSGEKPEPTMVEPFQTAIGIDIDCPNEKVYWSDVGQKMIKSAYFNGTGKNTFLHQDIGSPEGLSIDWGAQNVYWTDSSKDTIEVANLQTQRRKTLISTELVNPRGIAVYPQRGRLFWTDWNREYPKIEFSGLDGLGRQILIGEGLSLPNALLIDLASDQLCFADAGTHKIECVGIDGRGRRTFISGVKYPFGLALASDTFYWSDWETKNLERASRRNGVFGESIEVKLGGPGKLYGIVLIPKVCPPVYSPCTQTSCQDELMCLPNMRGGHSCRCSDTASVNCKDII